MIPEKILYTDGHEVTVTDSFFKVRKTLYQLKGITKHGFFIIHPDRVAPYLILLAGSIMISLAAFQWMPVNLAYAFKFYSMELILNLNAISMALGIVLIALGALLLILMKDRYAIWIATAEGEKNVVVSRKREYINQILDALNHAFFNLITSAQQHPRKRKMLNQKEAS